MSDLDSPLLQLALLQTDLVWENTEANLFHFDRLISEIPAGTDLVILPEMFGTGFSMDAKRLAETEDGQSVWHMKKWATQTGAAVCGSLMIQENGKYVNRFFWFEPNGLFYQYDKAHLFRMGDEQNHYSKGNDRILIPYKGWKIAPFICYDLRFPVWIRRTENFDYDLLLFVANWPERRVKHWQALTLARAIENQSFVAAVNRIGVDGNGIPHSGESCLLNPMGELIHSCGGKNETAILRINKTDLIKYRESFPVGLDTDKFEFC